MVDLRTGSGCPCQLNFDSGVSFCKCCKALSAGTETLDCQQETRTSLMFVRFKSNVLVSVVDFPFLILKYQGRTETCFTVSRAGLSFKTASRCQQEVQDCQFFKNFIGKIRFHSLFMTVSASHLQNSKSSCF